MKKVFLIIFLLSSVISNIYSQFEREYKLSNMLATEAAIKIPGYEYSSWEKLETPIKVYFNPAEERIIIFSKDIQIIDYVNLDTFKFSNYYQYVALATDTDYVKFKFNLYIYNSGLIILKLVYSNIEYKYKLYIYD